VIKSDQRGSNGVIHVIDRVIFPPEDTLKVITKNNLTSFIHLIRAANIEDDFKGINTSSPITVFAPTENAFHNTSRLLVDYLMHPNSTKELVNVLRYHQSYNVRYLNSFKRDEILAMRNGNTVTIKLHSNDHLNLRPEVYQLSVTVNGIPIVDADLVASNGVVHVIDGVLIPPNFQWTLFKALLGLNATEFAKAVMRSKDKFLDKLFTGVPPAYTVFVPTDQAFKKSTKIRLESILTNSDRLERLVKLHMVNESIEKIEEGKEYFTLLPGYRLVGGKHGECVFIVKGKSKSYNSTERTLLREPHYDSFHYTQEQHWLEDTGDNNNNNETQSEDRRDCVKVGQMINGPGDSVIFSLNEVLAEGGLSKWTIWIIVGICLGVTLLLILVFISVFIFRKLKKRHSYQPVM